MSKQTLSVHQLRNIGISAHIDSGKTTLAERMLYYCGRIHKMRDVRGGDGGATLDHDDIERKRGITINSAATRIGWRDFTINLIDTPGHVDFTVEVERSLRVLDGAVLVLCSVGGVQSQSVTVDQQMRRYGVPRIAFVNKMDRCGADPSRVIDQLRNRLGCNAVALQLPIGSGKSFEGLIDLITMQTLKFGGLDGSNVSRDIIPGRLLSVAKSARAELLESLAMLDDSIMQQMIDGHEPSERAIRSVIREATIARKLTPVLMGSAFKNTGVQEVLDAITMYLPDPQEKEVLANDLDSDSSQEQCTVPLMADPDRPLVAMAFKTLVETYGQLTFMRVYQGRLEKGETYRNVRTGRTVRFGRLVRIHADQREEISSADAGDIIGAFAVDCCSGDTFVGQGSNVSLENIKVARPVMQLAVRPAHRDDAEKLSRAIERFRREDPTFLVTNDPQTGQTLIAGMGQLHLEVYVERIETEFKCPCVVGFPRVTYKSRPTSSVEFQYMWKKQNGGQGQFAKIWGRLDLLPITDEESFIFESQIVGGRIDKRFIESVRQGFEQALREGPLDRSEVVGVRMTLTDGAQHEKDSSELAFKACGLAAMREQIFPNADLELLEPIMELDCELPDDDFGVVTSYVARKRGVVTSSRCQDGLCFVKAEAPLVELFEFANDLRSMTKGAGMFTMQPLTYRSAPRVVESAAKRA